MCDKVSKQVKKKHKNSPFPKVQYLGKSAPKRKGYLSHKLEDVQVTLPKMCFGKISTIFDVDNEKNLKYPNIPTFY